LFRAVNPTSSLESFEELTDEEAGRLAKHLFRYVNDLDPEAPDKITKMCFIPIKQSLKRDLVKYEERAERARLNGAKGGRPKTQKTQSVISEPKKPDSDNVSVSVNDSVNVIVSYLNSRVGSSFKASTDKTKRMINARLKEGFTVEDFKQVIETKAEEWENDPKFCKFLRPETLFSNKFESYLNQQQAGQSREDELKLHLLKHLRDVQSEDYIDEPTDANRMRRLS
jgi:uncharacterized phage protein (TIGR02220 family)